MNRFGPGGLPSSWLKRGKLCAPSHFSTSICQSVISTELMVMSGWRLNAGTQSSATASCFGGEERTIAGVEAVDPQILDQDLAGQQADAQRADVQRALDVLGAGVLGLGAHRRPEVDRDRRDDGRRQQRHEDREAEAGVADNRMSAEALEHVH